MDITLSPTTKSRGWNLFTLHLQQESIPLNCDTRRDHMLQITDQSSRWTVYLSFTSKHHGLSIYICVKEKSCNKRKQCAFNTWLPVAHHSACLWYHQAPLTSWLDTSGLETSSAYCWSLSVASLSGEELNWREYCSWCCPLSSNSKADES